MTATGTADLAPETTQWWLGYRNPSAAVAPDAR